MRSQPLARIITAAAALTVSMSSVVSAQQVDTDNPNNLGETLLTAVVTNSLDDPRINSIIVDTARAYHAEMGGKAAEPAKPKKGKKKNQEVPRGGFIERLDRRATGAVSGQVKETANEDTPDLLLISGGDGQTNVGISRTASNESVFIDLGQPRPCVTETGQPDGSGECAGSANGIPSSYTAVEFAVEDGAYLAGVLAARASRGGRLGVISGYEGCRECQRYVEGFVNGARRVDPEIDIVVDYIADDEVSAFGDPETARTFTEIFLDVYEPAVLMPIGRAANIAMIEAACAHEPRPLAIGTGRAVRETHPQLDCVMLSIVKDVPRAIREAMYDFSFKQTKRVMTYDVANGGVSITDDWAERVAWIPTDTRIDFYEPALSDITTGRRQACPDGCGGSMPDIEEPIS